MCVCTSSNEDSSCRPYLYFYFVVESNGICGDENVDEFGGEGVVELQFHIMIQMFIH